MARLTQLDDVLFPVAEHPIFASVKEAAGERRISVPDKKAILHGTTGRVLGVVSRGYRLVSNRQALEWARQCCRTVFPETREVELLGGSVRADRKIVVARARFIAANDVLGTILSVRSRPRRRRTQQDLRDEMRDALSLVPNGPQRGGQQGARQHLLIDARTAGGLPAPLSIVLDH